MIETTGAQLRLALSTAFGRRFRVRSLERLVAGMLETRREFGAIGTEAAALTGGPELDGETLRELQRRRFRQQARRAAATAYYGELFARCGFDPDRDAADTLPPTSKAPLRDRPEAFLVPGSRPVLRALTTGTTGRPVCVHFSRRELDAAAALTAIAGLMSGRVTPDDVVQACVSSRGVQGVFVTARACALVGTRFQQVGLVDPEVALGLLADGVTVLATVPSYLGALVEAAHVLGYRSADFRLARIFVGGEVVTPGLLRRTRAVLGDVEIEEGYTATEVLPLGAVGCSHGHLHFTPTVGLVEVLALDGSGPAAPGELGTLVVTPFAPYRETTLVLRYDTQDVVRVPVERPQCELASLPATSSVLGKLAGAVRHDRGLVFRRDVLAPLEELDCVPLPARYSVRAAAGGIALEVCARSGDRATRARIATALEDAGLPLRSLRVVTDPSALTRPERYRLDLREESFAELPRPARLEVA